MTNPPWCGPTRPDIDRLGALDALQAFDAMFYFIEAYWERGERSPGNLAILLTAIDRREFKDGGPGDPAMWEDWEEAVAKAREVPAQRDIQTPT